MKLKTEPFLMPEKAYNRLEADVRQVVLRHLPLASQVDEGDFQPSFADFHARWICIWYDRGSEAFRYSEDAELYSEVLSRAEGLRNSLLSLSGSDSQSLRRIYLNYEPFDHQPVDLVEILDVFLKAGRSPAHGIPDYRQANKKRNWRAMAVAEAARRAWGVEKWRIENGYPDIWKPGVQSAMWDEAPTSQHHDRPGPFGRFLNDLMETLCIFDKTGAPVSAATALNALREIGRK